MSNAKDILDQRRPCGEIPKDQNEEIKRDHF